MTETDYFAQIERQARETNDWRLIAAIQTSDGGDGYVPHGFAAIKRENWAERVPEHMADRAYATVSWFVQPNGAGFEAGHYDLTIDDALDDLLDRAKGRVSV